jgi:hypothetical protein
MVVQGLCRTGGYAIICILPPNNAGDYLSKRLPPFMLSIAYKDFGRRLREDIEKIAIK